MQVKQRRVNVLVDVEVAEVIRHQEGILVLVGHVVGHDWRWRWLEEKGDLQGDCFAVIGWLGAAVGLLDRRLLSWRAGCTGWVGKIARKREEKESGGRLYFMLELSAWWPVLAF